ncbi:hypothetical protein MMC07_001215 [Pseudocyphellaria aurata]|nr:hypothetical protein [Pseudocyphellaria aurata]
MDKTGKFDCPMPKTSAVLLEVTYPGRIIRGAILECNIKTARLNADTKRLDYDQVGRPLLSMKLSKTRIGARVARRKTFNDEYGDDDANDCFMAAGGNKTLDRTSRKKHSGQMADDGEITAGPEGYCMATDHRDALDRVYRVDGENTCIIMNQEDTAGRHNFCMAAIIRDKLDNEASSAWII